MRPPPPPPPPLLLPPPLLPPPLLLPPLLLLPPPDDEDDDGASTVMTTAPELLLGVESFGACSTTLLVNVPVPVAVRAMSIVRESFGGIATNVHCRVVVPVQMPPLDDTELTETNDGKGISTEKSRVVVAPLFTVMNGKRSAPPLTAVTLF